MNYKIEYIGPQSHRRRTQRKRRVAYPAKWNNYKAFKRLISKLQKAGAADFLEEAMKLASWRQRFRFAQRLRFEQKRQSKRANLFKRAK